MIPAGKGVFIWNLINCVGGDMDRLADMAAAAGFQWAAIKAADGILEHNESLIGAALRAFEARGVAVWGWQYLYGANKAGRELAGLEADVAIRVLGKYRLLAGWILDPEREYKRPGAAVWARRYMERVRGARPDVSLGLCSYRFPELHRELPWQEFLAGCTFHAPQVYWVQASNPGEQLRKSAGQLRKLADYPIVPIGSAYFEHGWRPTVGQLNEFDETAREMGLPGVGWWCWDDAGLERWPEYLEAITAHNWRPAPTAREVWVLAVDAFLRQLGYSGPEPGHEPK